MHFYQPSQLKVNTLQNYIILSDFGINDSKEKGMATKTAVHFVSIVPIRFADCSLYYFTPVYKFYFFPNQGALESQQTPKFNKADQAQLIFHFLHRCFY